MSGDDRSIEISNGNVGAAVSGEHAQVQIFNMRTNGKLAPDIPKEYYRINRKEQIVSLSSLITADPSKPAVCILYGDEDEAHDMFWECLTDSFRHKACSWFNYFNRAINDPNCHYIDWPLDTDKSSEIYIQVLSELANDVGLEYSASVTPEAINRQTRDESLFVYTMVASDCEELSIENGRRRLFEEFRAFWSKWPSRPPESPLVACLALIYRPENRKSGRFEKIWRRFFGKDDMNKINQEIEQSLKVNCSDEILPCLESVRYQDAIRWTREPDIRSRCCRSITGVVGNIYNDAGKKRIPMDRLSEALFRSFPLNKKTPTSE